MEVAVPTLKSRRRESHKSLVVPSEPDTHTFIPFGIDGTTVVINRYGEILKILQYITAKPPQIIALDTYKLQYPYMELHNQELYWNSQDRGTGFRLNLMLTHKDEKIHSEPILEWVNGRWPRISYLLARLEVSIQFSIEHGIVSQRLLIKNPFDVDKDLHFALQAGGSTVTTLHIEDDRWEMNEVLGQPATKPQIMQDLDGHFVLGEERLAPKLNDDSTKKSVTSEALIALFRNGNSISPNNIVLRPVEENKSPYQETPSTTILPTPRTPDIISIQPHGVQEVDVQYMLRPYGDNSRSVRYFDVGIFLASEQHGIWNFINNNDINTILLRHLEHILCTCIVPIALNSKSGPRIPFDTALASGSSPSSDL